MSDAASFAAQLRSIAAQIEQRPLDVFTGCTVEIQRSVVEGSEITASPGQPVDTSNLATSFIPERIAAEEWQTTTKVEYAPAVEAGLQPPYTTKGGTLVTPVPMTLRSAVGGFHSVALTNTGFERIVEHVRDQQPLIVARHSLDPRRRP